MSDPTEEKHWRKLVHRAIFTRNRDPFLPSHRCRLCGQHEASQLNLNFLMPRRCPLLESVLNLCRERAARTQHAPRRENRHPRTMDQSRPRPQNRPSLPAPRLWLFLQRLLKHRPERTTRSFSGRSPFAPPSSPSAAQHSGEPSRLSYSMSTEHTRHSTNTSHKKNATVSRK